MKKLGCLVLLIATGCYHFREPPGTATAEITATPVLVDTAGVRMSALAMKRNVQAFYGRRSLSLFWRERSREGSADSLLQIIRQAGRYGLIANDYHLPALDTMLRDSVSGERVILLDLLLTDSYLTLRHHLRHGRLDPKTLQRKDLANVVNDGDIAALEAITPASVRRTLESAEPAAPQYHFLKKNLPLLAGTSPAGSQQLDHGVAIGLNMERWRWEKPLPARHISVNIPAYQLRVVEHDSVWLTSRVIVGRRQTPTPVMESVISSFIIYPYWHAPHSIATRELLPELQRDPAYLAKNNFEVLDKQGKVVDASALRWEEFSADHFPFVLRQREGSENSMGIIRFNFPNPYGVYMHDTNGKLLYNRERRDLSHGCVRVQRAIPLAHYLVREDDIYVSPEDLDQYLSLQQRLKVELRKPIALRLSYFTVEVEGGVPVYHEDIYKKDSLMMETLFPSPAVPVAGDVTIPL